jgi:methyltransferase (TIGR00027 family)
MAAPAQAKAKEGPSWSAYRVALLRAQHQMVEGGSIFFDPFALPITGESVDRIARSATQFASLRRFVAARSRFAEDCLAQAVARGVRQVVVLGAGLDTFALRNPYTDKGVRVFEVDRAETQTLKRRCLARANLAVPPGLTFVTVDFERQSFVNRLFLSGFNVQEPVFFIWLGVVVYLSRKAVSAGLAAIASLPDAEVVFDYGEPPASIAEEHRPRYLAMIARAKASGDPRLSVFTPQQMATGLEKIGFSDWDDLGPDAVASRYFPKELSAGSGGHLVRARKAFFNAVPSAT